MIYVIQRGDADGRRLFVTVSKPIEILNNVSTIKISGNSRKTEVNGI